jgi:hypothetical protein
MSKQEIDEYIRVSREIFARLERFVPPFRGR